MNRYLGSVKFNKINVFLQQEPYLADSKLFTAIGQDEDGQEYKIEWKPDPSEEFEDLNHCQSCTCAASTTYEFRRETYAITPFKNPKGKIMNNQL